MHWWKLPTYILEFHLTSGKRFNSLFFYFAFYVSIICISILRCILLLSMHFNVFAFQSSNIYLCIWCISMCMVYLMFLVFFMHHVFGVLTSLLLLQCFQWHLDCCNRSWVSKFGGFLCFIWFKVEWWIMGIMTIWW
jgi:hypothetical protein